MAGFVPQETLDRILDATDIVALVNQYVPLKRAGQTYKALCPFHNEKTPSFTVSPQRGTFKCFGCGLGGNAFQFVMHQEHCDFPEAVALLAERAGIELPKTGGESIPRDERSMLLDLLKRAADFYHKALQEPAARKARDYLARRKIDDAAVKRWALGYAPAGWSNLLDHAQRGGARRDLLERAGLIVKAQEASRHYDRFRDRLMFPISDPRGQVIGFGARCLDDSEPKYLNSPQTALFDKSRCLYGLYQAKAAIGQKRQVVIVEGYTDVIMAHAVGVENVVATLGTALTRQHIDLLRRYADEAVLVFDADTAGAKASDRSLEIFVERELPARIAALSAGEDPCDFCLAHGGEAFVERIQQARALFSYKIDLAAALKGESTRKRAEAVDDLLRLLTLVPGSVERNMRLNEVAREAAEKLNVDERALRARFKELSRGRPRRASDEGEAVLKPEAKAPPLETELVGLAISDAAALQRLAEELAPDDVTDERLRTIYCSALEMYRDSGEVEERRLVSALADPELGSMIVDLVSESLQRGSLEERLEGVLGRWRRQEIRRKAQQVQREMKQADEAGMTDRVRQLHQQYLELIRQT